MSVNIHELSTFFAKAALATYAGDGQPIDAWRPGHYELEYQEGDWYYRDSFSGFMQSWGQEIIWYKNKPVWTQLYGGGMEKQFHNDTDFTEHTFAFLKKALSSGNKKKQFQPRGPERYMQKEWEYYCNVRGTMRSFSGEEIIVYQKNSVFTHQFFGGLFLSSSP